MHFRNFSNMMFFGQVLKEFVSCSSMLGSIFVRPKCRISCVLASFSRFLVCRTYQPVLSVSVKFFLFIEVT